MCSRFGVPSMNIGLKVFCEKKTLYVNMIQKLELQTRLKMDLGKVKNSSLVRQIEM